MANCSSDVLPSKEIPTSDPCSTADLREQLFNGGLTGNFKEIQVSTERIAQINGILYDLDPHLFRPNSIFPVVPPDPHEFYAAVIRPMLERHDVLSRAEVRISGMGLHCIPWFDAPVIINSDAERDRWAGIIQVVQCALPIDPDQPHITALTRPIGSTNSKNGAPVSLLSAGAPISEADVIRLYEQMSAAPFKTVAKILAGAERIEPCPICQQAGSHLSALNFIGQCYGSCGKVRLEQLYDLILVPRPQNRQEGAGHDASSL